MFYNPSKPPTLECEVCGEVVRTLTQKEAEIVAERPYDCISYCFAHRISGPIEQAERDGLR